MRKILLNNIFTLIIIGFLSAQHFNVQLANTGESQLTIFLDTTITNLDLGDEIGIFDLEAITNYNDCSNQIGELLVGAGVWDDNQLNIVSTGSVDLCGFGGSQFPGFVAGNDVVVRVWKADEEMEYETVLTWGTGDGVFGDIIQAVSEITLVACEGIVDDCGVCDGGNADDLGCGCFEPAPETYYQDHDGDGLGSGEGQEFCLDDVPEGWVNNNDDDNDGCEDDNDATAAFGGCAAAVAALGCDFVYAGSPVLEWCPETCGECIVCNDDEACNTGAEGDCEYTEENYDCDGNCIVETDCAGVCAGTAELDECDECDGDGIDEGTCDCDGNVDLGCGCGEPPSGCDGICGSNLEFDECGECGGDNSTCNAVSYSSENTSFTGDDLTSIPITISDSGTITDLNIQITLDHEYNDGLEYTSVALLSPYGNTVLLGAGNELGGDWSDLAKNQLYDTIFDDEASIDIYSGTSPFSGLHQPSGSLSDFDNQEIQGTWELLIITIPGNDNQNVGTVEFTIIVETDSSDPVPHPDYGIKYSSESASFASNTITSIPITITDSWIITDLNIQITLDHEYNDGLEYTSVALLSPYENAVLLGTGNELGGDSDGLTENRLYKTIFDDEASTDIYSGASPFVGPYQPSGSLADFDNQTITGVWELLIVNNHEDTGTVEFTIMVKSMPPIAQFIASPTSGQVPLTVEFTNLSVDLDGEIVDWYWDFGDGNTSNQENPTHTYTVNDIYTVTLTTTDNAGMTNTIIQEDYISADYPGPVWYISNNGDDTAQGTSDDPFATIGLAIYNASDGDSILIDEGDYGDLNVDKQLFIGSLHYQNLDSTIISNTTLGSAHFFSSASGSEIQGLNIKSNSDSYSLQIESESNGLTDLNIESCHITENTNSISAVYLHPSSEVSMDSCLISNNSSRGVYIDNDAELLISNTTISNNASTGISVQDYAELSMNNIIIDNNGGIGIFSTGEDLQINTATISNNGQNNNDYDYDSYAGSGIYLDLPLSCYVSLNHVDIINNNGRGLVTNGSNNSYLYFDFLSINGNKGRGIHTLHNAYIDHSDISYNEDGGAYNLFNVDIQNTSIHHNIISRNDNGAGINLLENCSLTNTTIEHNKAIYGYGGGIYINSPGNSQLYSTTIRYNYARYGGGVYQYSNSNFLDFVSTSNSVYSNYAITATDFYWSGNGGGDATETVHTFTVEETNVDMDYYAYRADGGDFTIESINHIINPIIMEVYVSPDGSNDNTGTAASPFKNIHHALLAVYANSGLPATIHLADGTYSPSTNGELFPLGGKNHVSFNGASREGTILDADSLSSIFYIPHRLGDISISDLTITNGHSINSGGGIYLSNTDLSLERVTVSYNVSTAYGGGIYLWDNDAVEKLTINNSLFINNAASAGGGIYFNDSNGSNDVIISSTITGNSGGGIYCSYGPTTLINSIVSVNSSYNYNQSGSSNSYNSISEIDPVFVDADNGDYHLQNHSPLIGAGIDSVQIASDSTWYFASETDIEGNLRPNPAGSSPDIGAYENPLAEPLHNSLIYVSTTGSSTTGNGFLNSPFYTIQEAINSSEDGDTVYVQSGSYTESINFNGKNIIVQGENRHNTTIYGSWDDYTVLFDSDETSTSKLEELTIDGLGRGIKCIGSSSPTITNCIIKSCFIYEHGAGIYIGDNASPTISNCLIYNNNAYNYPHRGGGMYITDQASPYIENCTISENSAYYTYDADMFITYSVDLTVINSIIWDGTNSYGNIEATYSNIDGNLEGEGNISVNPQFVGGNYPSSWEEFNLQSTSPCIDTGDPDPQYNDPDGTRADMGAIYYDQIANPFYGCMDIEACNYNESVIEDNGTCEYPEENYDCNGSCIVELDCLGECDGLAVVDDCGVCDTDSSNDNKSCTGCTDVDACNYKPENTIGDSSCLYNDCAGECDGPAIIDECGECGGDGIDEGMCDCDGNVYNCAGECGGSLDGCEECEDGYNCTGICGGKDVLDCAGECGGVAVIDCNDECNGEAVVDSCEVCSGGNSEHEADSDKDCADVCFGDSEYDCLSVCGGDAELDCAGDCNGDAELDCVDECNGNAFIDGCDECIEEGDERNTCIPKLTQITPSYNDLLSLRATSILFDFSIPVAIEADTDPITISTDVYDEDFAFNVSNTESSNQIELQFEDNLASLDTMIISLHSDYIKSLNDASYQFDANQNDLIDDTSGAYDISFNTPLLGDFNNDSQIDFYDMVLFVNGWFIDNYDYEIGPSTGQAPHLITNFDNAFTFDDIASFMLMWNWSDDFISSDLARIIQKGTPPIFHVQDDIISIDLSEYEENISALYIRINTQTSDIEVTSDEIKYGFDISLPRKWEDENIYEWNFGNPSNKDIQDVNICMFKTAIKEKQDILIDYQIISLEGLVISSGNTQFEYTPIPDNFSLDPAYPNPFNPTTTIQFGLPEAVNVNLSIYDINGRLVSKLADKQMESGYHKILWNGSQYSSGIYFIRMHAGDYTKIQKITLLK